MLCVQEGYATTAEQRIVQLQNDLEQVDKQCFLGALRELVDIVWAYEINNDKFMLVDSIRGHFFDFMKQYNFSTKQTGSENLDIKGLTGDRLKQFAFSELAVLWKALDITKDRTGKINFDLNTIHKYIDATSYEAIMRFLNYFSTDTRFQRLQIGLLIVVADITIVGTALEEFYGALIQAFATSTTKEFVNLCSDTSNQKYYYSLRAWVRAMTLLRLPDAVLQASIQKGIDRQVSNMYKLLTISGMPPYVNLGNKAPEPLFKKLLDALNSLVKKTESGVGYEFDTSINVVNESIKLVQIVDEIIRAHLSQ
jgi:hypothetical protein